MLRIREWWCCHNCPVLVGVDPGSFDWDRLLLYSTVVLPFGSLPRKGHMGPEGERHARKAL